MTAARDSQSDSQKRGMQEQNMQKQGMQKRRAVLGDAHVDRAEAAKTEFDTDFQAFITRYAWGEVWQGEALTLKERHLITLALLAALGKESEFAVHVRATARTGVTDEELAEALKTVALYAGVPAANTAFKLAKQVHAEREA